MISDVGRLCSRRGKAEELGDGGFRGAQQRGDHRRQVEAALAGGAHDAGKDLLGVGTVFAFEPQRIVAQVLAANVALNSLTNVHTYHLGVGAEDGALGLVDIDYSREGNFGGVSLDAAARPRGRPRPKYRVAVVRLDDFYDQPRLDLIKTTMTAGGATPAPLGDAPRGGRKAAPVQGRLVTDLVDMSLKVNIEQGLARASL